MEVEQILHQSIAEVADIAKALESGQARSPCYEHVVSLSEVVKAEALNAIVLCFQADFFTHFARGVVNDFPAGVMPAELVINDGPASIENGNTIETFEDTAALFVHAQSSEGQVVSCDRLQVAGVDGMAPARLLVADPAKLLALDLSEFNRLVNRANVLIIAAPLDYSVTNEDRAVMLQLLRHVHYLSVLALPPAGEAVSAKPWYQEPIPAHVKTVPPFKLEAGKRPRYLTDATCAQRRQMIKSMVFQTLKQSVALIDEQIDERLHYLDCCEEGDEFTLALLEHDPEVTANVEHNRQVVEDLAEELIQYTKHLQDESKHSLVGKGVFHLMVERELEALQPEDIEKEAVHTVYRLTVSPAALKSISQQLARRLQSRFEDERNKVLEHINAQFTAKRKGLRDWSQGLSAAADQIGEMVSLSERSGDHLDFKIRYKGEMPKRSFFKRVGEGRRTMFMVLMMFSIFGGMLGFNYRNYAFMTVFFVLLFLGGTVWTYVSWRRDDAFKMSGELEKAREQLHSEYLRAVGEIERNRVKSIADDIMTLIKQNKQALDQWHKRTAETLKQSVDQVKEQDKRKRSMLKAESTAKQALKTSVQKIVDRLDALEGTLRNLDEQLKFG